MVFCCSELNRLRMSQVCVATVVGESDSIQRVRRCKILVRGKWSLNRVCAENATGRRKRQKD